MIRTFIYTKTCTSVNRYWGYSNITLRIYEVIGNAPKYKGITKYRTGSSVGDEFEVFQWILANCEIDSDVLSTINDKNYYNFRNPYIKIFPV